MPPAPVGLVLIAHAAATWAMTGLIWFVQVVHYPLDAIARGSAAFYRRVFLKAGSRRLETFYRAARTATELLMDGRVPVGGAWNYDAENRRPRKGDPPAPASMTFAPDAITREVMTLVATRYPASLGCWREFVRRVYEEHRAHDATANALDADVPLPGWYWGAPSGMHCLDTTVADVLTRGYSHHITRLMVLSHIATLSASIRTPSTAGSGRRLWTPANGW